MQLFENFKKVYENVIKRINEIPIERHHSLTGVTYPLAEEKWRDIKLEWNHHREHLSFVDDPMSKLLRGKFFISSQGWSSEFREASPTEIMSAAVIAQGGMYLDSFHKLGSLRKGLFQFLSNCMPQNTSLGDERTNTGSIKPVFYIPDLSRTERYKELLKYSTDHSYYSEEAARFADQYLLPRIISGEGIFLYNYSAACRENLMIENRCREVLGSKPKLSKNLQSLLNRIHTLNIGHAFDWDHLPKPNFSRFTVTSVEDFLVLRPYSNLKLLYQRMPLSSVQLFKRSDFVDESEFACVIGTGALPLQLEDKINYFGHELHHYQHAINQHVDIYVRREIAACVFPAENWKAVSVGKL
ncbi:MAG: hypothetical protein JSS10_06990 [Verrucomicrobia bacterium]|nr:hypothetical protein [Verrucomicrobiota bacterium]